MFHLFEKYRGWNWPIIFNVLTPLERYIYTLQMKMHPTLKVTMLMLCGHFSVNYYFSFTFTYHTLVAMCAGYWLSDKRLFTTKMMFFHTLGKCLTQHLVQDINKMFTYIDPHITCIKHISYHLLREYFCSYYYLII